MIYKRCGRCGKRLPSGTTCDCVKKLNAARHKDYDRNKRSRTSYDFYHSSEWIRARAEALERDSYIDVYAYMTRGEVLPADTVHHIIPLTDDWSKRVDIDNLISLNHSTHSAIEQEYVIDAVAAQKKIQKMLYTYRHAAH